MARATCEKNRQNRRSWYQANNVRILERMKNDCEYEPRDPLYMAPEARDRIERIIKLLTWHTDQVEDTEYMIRTAMKARRELGLVLEGKPSEDEIRRLFS
jgi:hypothetical protein